MANIKITDLTAYTDPLSTDVLPIVDVTSDTTKKVSVADLLENAGTGTAAAPGIAFDGDSNTGIYNPGADELAITTNSSERIRVGSSGEIGLSGANYGTSGQVLTSAGSGAAPTWTTVSSGGTDLTYTASTRVIASSTGTDATLTEVVAAGDSGLMTGADKTKLDGIATGAEVNVDTDLSYTASTRVLASSTGTNATLPEVVAAGDSGLMTGADKTKLDGIATGATNVTNNNQLTNGAGYITATVTGDFTVDTSTFKVDSTNNRVGVGQATPIVDLDVDGAYAGNITAVAALDIDCSTANYFTKTISTSSTFTFSNAPSSRAYGFTLELTHTSGTVTWPAAVKWPADTSPTLTTGKTHLFVFVTDDGGTRWRGASSVDYVN